jgi:hypothetical protein
MKTLNTYIIEKLKIRKSDDTVRPITKKELPKFVDNLYNCLDTKEPINDKEEYIAVYFNSSRYLEVSDTYYINIYDLENHTDKDSVLTIFYNLAKHVDNKYIGAGIMLWDPTRNDYCEFAHASLRANDRMWNPEFIKTDKHPFI